MGKRHSDSERHGEELPWQVELPFWLVAVLVSIAAAATLVWSFNEPARDLEVIFGITHFETVDTVSCQVHSIRATPPIYGN